MAAGPSTRWSMLDGLSGPEAEAAWLWFVERYRPMIGSLLVLHLDATRAT